MVSQFLLDHRSDAGWRQDWVQSRVQARVQVSVRDQVLQGQDSVPFRSSASSQPEVRVLRSVAGPVQDWVPDSLV